jgi:hypothetical protein
MGYLRDLASITTGTTSETRGLRVYFPDINTQIERKDQEGLTGSTIPASAIIGHFLWVFANQTAA